MSKRLPLLDRPSYLPLVAGNGQSLLYKNTAAFWQASHTKCKTFAVKEHSCSAKYVENEGMLHTASAGPLNVGADIHWKHTKKQPKQRYIVYCSP